MPDPDPADDISSTPTVGPLAADVSQAAASVGRRGNERLERIAQSLRIPAAALTDAAKTPTIPGGENDPVAMAHIIDQLVAAFLRIGDPRLQAMVLTFVKGLGAKDCSP